MKVRISDKIRGEFLLKAVDKTFPAGATVELTSEQMSDPHTRWAIANGVIETDEKYEVKMDGRFFVSNHKRPLALSALKMAVNPGQKFFITNKQLEDSQIVQAIGLGLISDFVEEEPQKTVVTSKKNTKDISESKIGQSKESSSKTLTALKEVGEEKKAPQNEGLLKSREKNKKIKNAYIHEPEGANLNKPPRMIKSKPILPKSDSMILDLNPNNEEVD